MNKENFHADLKFNSVKKSKDINSSFNSKKTPTNTTESVEQSYIPKMRTGYNPSSDDVESATGVDFPVNMPNPAVDPIVSNNIANQEFDYTEDMLSFYDSDES